MNRIISALAILFFVSIQAQSIEHSSTDIYDDLLRLKNNTTVMYIAAHPDDENTRIISWLTHDQHVDAVYLSLTRGDGGQNLIGTEKGNLLGLLRTQELLEARKVDKGRQWFTRAIDFGYSKTATETLALWDEDKILSDVVWAIRKNKPEVIITRFDPNSNGKTHGHHTASAILALKAYELAADKNAYPEQLEYVDPWQVKRVFFNTSWWFYGSQEKFDKVDKSDMIAIDVGTYYPILGKSNNEIAAESRSKHACQGFGMALERGSEIEWLQLLKGDMPQNNDIFDGINKQNNKPFHQQMELVLNNYDFKNPQNSLEDLINLYKIAQKQNLNTKRLNAIKDIIVKAAGLYTEWTTSTPFTTNEQPIDTRLEITNRSYYPIHIVSDALPNHVLSPNEQFEFPIMFNSNVSDFDTPYWLELPHDGYLYHIKDQQLIGQAETPKPIKLAIDIQILDTWFMFDVPLQYKTVDPSIGEIYQPFYVVPDVLVNFKHNNYIFNNNAKEIEIEVISYRDNLNAKVSIVSDNGWEVLGTKSVNIKHKGEKQKLSFEVAPFQHEFSNVVRANVYVDDKVYSNSMAIVDYPHIDKQIVISPAKATIKNLNMEVPKVKVGYIQGSGDDVPAALADVGLDVDVLDLNDLTQPSVDAYDVIILGIRAFNTQDALINKNQILWNFVENGGVLINQYNTNRSLITEEIAPYPLSLGRDRISEENASLNILEPTHPIFQIPNKIISQDFEDWVQERGLYFATEWDDNFTPLLEGHDTNESPKQGILLVADYGKGHYIYTGLSFFRELPAGVPGAYRLFMNMLAMGAN